MVLHFIQNDKEVKNITISSYYESEDDVLLCQPEGYYEYTEIHTEIDRSDQQL